MGQTGQCFLTFQIHNVSHFPVDGLDGGHHGQFIQPSPESQQRFLHKTLRPDGLLFPLTDICFNNIFQIVNIINIGIGYFIDPGINIPGYGNINKKQGLVLSFFHDALDLITG